MFFWKLLCEQVPWKKNGRGIKMQSHGKKKKFRWRNYMADDLIGFLENFSALMEFKDDRQYNTR